MAWVASADGVRIISAATTGVATGLLGGVVPVVGLTGGLLLQLLAPTNPQLQRFERVTEGVVDGSAALIGLALFR
jgi:hypothetical protein